MVCDKHNLVKTRRTVQVEGVEVEHVISIDCGTCGKHLGVSNESSGRIGLAIQAVEPLQTFNVNLPWSTSDKVMYAKRLLCDTGDVGNISVLFHLGLHSLNKGISDISPPPVTEEKDPANFYVELNSVWAPVFQEKDQGTREDIVNYFVLLGCSKALRKDKHLPIIPEDEALVEDLVRKHAKKKSRRKL